MCGCARANQPKMSEQQPIGVACFRGFWHRIRVDADSVIGKDCRCVRPRRPARMESLPVLAITALDPRVVFWILVAVEAMGLTSASLVRLSAGCRSHQSCQWLFMACLSLVGFASVVAMGISSSLLAAVGRDASDDGRRCGLGPQPAYARRGGLKCRLGPEA